MPATAYKSSPTRLVRLLRRSRDTWKQRAADKQAALKKLRITVRDLAASRDHWRTVARQKTQELAALRDQPPSSQPPILLGEA